MLHRDGRFAILFEDFEWPVFKVLFEIWIVDLATNQAFRVENCVLGVGMVSVFRTVADAKGRRE